MAGRDNFFWFLERVLPCLRIFLAVCYGAAASALLSGCTMAGNETGQSLALAQTADLTLPDSVSVLPSPSTQIAFAGPEPQAAGDAGNPSQSAALNAPSAYAAVPAGTDVREQSAADAVADEPRGDVQQLIAKYAAMYDVPVELVRSVAKRESNFRPTAYNNGHWGLMQIKHATARGMGYRGPAKGLLDAETNLKYSVKYLRGAWLVADGNHKLADRLYQRGYYYDAKRKGMLEETGLGKDRRRRRAASPDA